MVFHSENAAEAPILFITDYRRVHCKAESKVFSDYLIEPLINALKTHGISTSQYGFVSAELDWESLKTFVRASKASTLVVIGEQALANVTGLKSISKWQCSVVPATAELGGRLCLPIYHPDHVMVMWSDHFYYHLAASKLAKGVEAPPERKFVYGLTANANIQYIRDLVMTAPVIGLDYEFGSGQLNTVGFAISKTEAIAIKVLPEDYTVEEYHALWTAIANVLESNVPKVIQHAAVEVTWSARYGISVNNVIHDTMWAMKYMYPELDKGLDNVGRIFTPFPYWKDDNDDWTNIRDWNKHLEYNCKDTTATLWAYYEQCEQMTKADTIHFFQSFLMEFQPVITEMCVTGLPVDQRAQASIREGVVRERDNFANIIDSICINELGKPINPNSWQQKQEALKAMGMVLPTKKNKKTGETNESTDKKALFKLRRRYPDNQILPALIGLSAASKKLSGYLDFDYDRQSSRMHYILDGCGTETGRWSGYGASWGGGVNPQTVPKSMRRCFTADADTVLVQIDLKQAESRYVAWEGPDPILMQLIEDGRDIHKYVAGKIFNKPEDFVTSLERNLGKKAGHASNYGTGPRTFAEMALVEMNHYLEEWEAKRILEMYMQTFPGIRRRQQNIKNEIYRTRMLTTPLGRRRDFFGRMNDQTFREAYAYAPQSTIPDITNHLMLALWRERDYLGLSYEDGGRFLLQVHDSLLLQCKKERVDEVAAFAHDLESWHPRISLAGGPLLIPVDVEWGPNWKDMEKI